MNIEDRSGGNSYVIGLISDTHGMVRPGVHRALAGVQLILHAGDVGDGVIHELALIAPVRAVRGNTDPIDDLALENFISVTLGGVSIHVSHGHEVGTPKPDKLFGAYGEDVIVYGHTHRGLIQSQGHRLVINPGAAGARRFSLLPSVARLTLDQGLASAVLIELADE